jgi:hypothetical protein
VLVFVLVADKKDEHPHEHEHEHDLTNTISLLSRSPAVTL